MIDGLAFEPQFLQHLMPVWSRLPDHGRLLVESSLAHLAPDAEPVDRRALNRAQPLPPKADPADGPIALATSIGDIKMGRRLGYRRFVFMEHGAGQAYEGVLSESYAGNKGREDVELFLCPNEYSAARFRATYPAARVEVVGSPRLDDLPRRQIDPIAPDPTIALSFHWPAAVCPEADTALGTFFGVLPELAKRFHVIGHAHPKGDWPTRMQRVYRRAGIEWVSDFDEICRRADLYVCDNSSTLFEFASTGRPVVVLNGRQYRRNVHHGLRFWDAASVGIQVDDPALLGDAIEEALRDEPDTRAAREAALSIVYAHRSGGAARAVRVITKWLDSRKEIAA